jgi:hypothetical protein
VKITIIDTNGISRQVEYVKAVSFPIFDAIHKTEIMTDYVEVKIIGHNMKWIQWYPIKEFKKRNPKVNLDGC